MKNFSITTALVSLLALYGANAFSAETEVKKDQKQLTVTKSEVKKGDIKNAASKKELKVSLKSADKKKPDNCQWMRPGPRVMVGGEFISYFWGKWDKEGFDVAPGATGDIKGNSNDYSNSHGAEADAVLRMKAENRNGNLGITYGADAQVGILSVKSHPISSKVAYNRGAKAFIGTEYGNVSVGYQQGAEAAMRIDTSIVAAGDGSSRWIQHVNLEGNDGTVPFYLSPVLYSESLNNLSHPLAIKGTFGSSELTAIGKRDYVNTLPLRIAYQSPNFMGAKLAISYAPSGYEEKLLVGQIIKSAVDPSPGPDPGDGEGSGEGALRAEGDETAGSKNKDAAPKSKTKEEIVPGENLAGKYSNIVALGLIYDYNYDDINVRVGLTGEYGKSVKAADVKTHYQDDGKYAELNDLMAVALGLSTDVMGIKVAGSFGWLGKSGVPKAIYTWKTDKYDEEGADKIADDAQKNTYYLTVGAGYEFEGIYGSVSYFHSNKYDGNKFHDVGVGAEYNLALGPRHKTQYKVFANYHWFKTEQKGVEEADKDKKNNTGSVLLGGIKFEF